MKRLVLVAVLAIFAVAVSVVWTVQARVVFDRAAESAADGIAMMHANLEYQPEPELCRFAQEFVREWGSVDFGEDVLPILLSAAGARVLGQDGFWIGYAAASPLAVALFFAVLMLICRDKLESPPWFLDLARDAYTATWALRTEPTDISRVAEGVMKKLSGRRSRVTTGFNRQEFVL